MMSYNNLEVLKLRMNLLFNFKHRESKIYNLRQTSDPVKLKTWKVD